jgi:hypothetical protein
MSLFTDAYGIRPWAVITLPLLLVGGVILACVLLLGPNLGCPKGTTPVTTGYYPLMVGKVMVMEPIISCEATK